MNKNIFKIAMISSLGLGIVGCSSLPQEDWNKYEDDSYKYQKVENQTVQGNASVPVSLELNDDDTLIQADWEILLAEYKNIPSYLWENCKQVHVKSYTAIADEVETISSDCVQTIDGYGYVSDNQEIYIAPITQGWTERNENSSEDYEQITESVTMIDENTEADDKTVHSHTYTGEEAKTMYELAAKDVRESCLTHALWHIYDSVNNASQDATFLKLYNATPNALGEDCGSSVSEFFATAGEKYLSGDVDFEEQNTDIYKYFANRFQF